jgi:hypothetical protein
VHTELSQNRQTDRQTDTQADSYIPPLQTMFAGDINITKTTESVEVPPHSHTTQATNATIANANRQ